MTIEINPPPTSPSELMGQLGVLCAQATDEPVSISVYCRLAAPTLIAFRVSGGDELARLKGAQAIAIKVGGTYLGGDQAALLYNMPTKFTCDMRLGGRATFGLQCSRCRTTTPRQSTA